MGLYFSLWFVPELGPLTFISGYITPGKTLGPWGKVAAAAFVAYWVGKLTYLLGNSCKEKFLR